MDREQWNAELETCYGRVLRGLTAVGGSRSLAEDALHDAIAAALRPGVVDKIERVDGWLFAVGLRALRRARWRLVMERTFGLIRLRPNERDSSDLVALDLLRDLTARQRELVIARYYLDLSYGDIAKHFGIAPGTARATVSQALSRLRHTLAEQEEATTWKIAER